LTTHVFVIPVTIRSRQRRSLKIFNSVIETPTDCSTHHI